MGTLFQKPAACTKALLVPMMCEPGAHNLSKHVRRLFETSVRTKSRLLGASARTMAQLLPMVSEPAAWPSRGMWRTRDRMMPMVCEITDCSSQGICRGWSRHLGTPRRGWCRWCASQHAAAAQGMCRGWSRHLRGPWYQLLPMVCEPASRPSQPETEACRGIRADHGPVSADGVRDRCP